MSDNTELIAKARKAIFPWEPELCVDVVHALESSTVQLAAAQAVIAEIQAFCASQGAPRPYPIEPFTFDKGVVAALSDVHKILTQSPVDALAAHDRQVAAKALEEAAVKFTEQFIDQQSGIGFPRVRVELLHAEAAEYRSTVKGEGN